MNIQLPLALLSLGALMLFQFKEVRTRRWANVVGLASQPFWLYATYMADQWGMFLLACTYTGVYVGGISLGFTPVRSVVLYWRLFVCWLARRELDYAQRTIDHLKSVAVARSTVAANFQHANQAGNDQSERLYAEVYPLLSPERRAYWEGYLGLPTH